MKLTNPGDIIGKNINEARGIATSKGLTIRVMEEDGESYVGTCDFRPDRINVVVKEGKVVEITGNG